jgi:S-adenosylmethionine:tRNA ribosyltransferase-isomerase
MDPTDFNYDLPAKLIAQAPLATRDASRLLYVPAAGEYQEYQFRQVSQLLQPGDLLVFNDTRVIPGRLFGRKASGGKVEMLLERILEPTLARVQLRSSRSPGEGSQLIFEPGIKAVVEGREGAFFLLRFAAELQPVLEEHGHVPLPPYINRADQAEDRERYQTVFAREPGAVAAPTAGLHFNDELLADIESKGVELARLTLHVGAGTFLPLRAEQIKAGRLHRERITVSEEVCAAVSRTRERGGRVIAVGTTVVRALESVALKSFSQEASSRESSRKEGGLSAYSGETDIFIQPGYKFAVVDAMITNFHLPESSLLMLVSAFHGTAEVLAAYRYAVAQKFRFFSYGDAMFLERNDAKNEVLSA